MMAQALVIKNFFSRLVGKRKKRRTDKVIGDRVNFIHWAQQDVHRSRWEVQNAQRVAEEKATLATLGKSYDNLALPFAHPVKKVRNLQGSAVGTSYSNPSTLCLSQKPEIVPRFRGSISGFGLRASGKLRVCPQTLQHGRIPVP